MKSKFFSGIVKCLGPVVRFIFRIKLHGLENEPSAEDGPYVMICNHVSNADPVFLCSGGTVQQPHFMAKKELFKIPLLKNLISALGAYPVDRKGADVSAVKKTIQMLKDGKCVGIFPQGHREMGIHPRDAHLKQGAAMIAVKAQVTVLPCCVKMKKNRFAFFRRVDVYFGKPIRFEELNYDPEATGEYMRISNQIFAKVCELYDAAEAEEQKREKRR